MAHEFRFFRSERTVFCYYLPCMALKNSKALYISE